MDPVGLGRAIVEPRTDDEEDLDDAEAQEEPTEGDVVDEDDCFSNPVEGRVMRCMSCALPRRIGCCLGGLSILSAAGVMVPAMPLRTLIFGSGYGERPP